MTLKRLAKLTRVSRVGESSLLSIWPIGIGDSDPTAFSVECSIVVTVAIILARESKDEKNIKKSRTSTI